MHERAFDRALELAWGTGGAVATDASASGEPAAGSSAHATTPAEAGLLLGLSACPTAEEFGDHLDSLLTAARGIMVSTPEHTILQRQRRLAVWFVSRYAGRVRFDGARVH
jgi:hypothetical protein